jgi:hypothetical protein
MMNAIQPSTRNRTPWNKGKLVGPKAPFKPKDIWTIRLQLQQHHRTRELALLNLGIDSKLRGCDLVTLKVRDISHGERIAPRATIQQKQTGRPVQFEITPVTRQAVHEWIHQAELVSYHIAFNRLDMMSFHELRGVVDEELDRGRQANRCSVGGETQASR